MSWLRFVQLVTSFFTLYFCNLFRSCWNFIVVMNLNFGLDVAFGPISVDMIAMLQIKIKRFLSVTSQSLRCLTIRFLLIDRTMVRSYERNANIRSASTSAVMLNVFRSCRLSHPRRYRYRNTIRPSGYQLTFTRAMMTFCRWVDFVRLLICVQLHSPSLGDVQWKISNLTMRPKSKNYWHCWIIQNGYWMATFSPNCLNIRPKEWRIHTEYLISYSMIPIIIDRPNTEYQLKP